MKRCASAFFLSVGLFTISLYGQVAKPLATTPPIEKAFPFVQKGAEVHVSCPVALNEYEVLSPEEVLHLFCVKSQRVAATGEKSESSENAAPSGRHHGGGMGGMGGGMGRGGMGMGGMGMGGTGGGGMRGTHGGTGGAGDGDEGSSRQGVDRKTVWTSVDAFREALGGLDGSDLRLVFAQPPAASSGQPAKSEDGGNLKTESKPRRVRDEPLVLPLGLLLGEWEGRPTVLAVETGGAGAEAGLRSGDRIISLDGRPCFRSLSVFLGLYREAKARGGSSVSLEVERGQARLTLPVSLPPSLGGSILDAP
ncbi:PDZ domain-containing protein [Verrucomicrobium sp. 3C]|uniref:PDZ domain-containing protein n=1 Tax=Verrucomicrobium sp. 3C TaxID=1134055 RepID=UPI0003A3037B|nr:PDZ domain-containing protein [Verrucomicrobium sp. 3C]